MSKLESSRQGPPGLLRVVPMVLVPLSLLGCVALVYGTGGARRRQILEEVDRWNTQEGRPKVGLRQTSERMGGRDNIVCGFENFIVYC